MLPYRPQTQLWWLRGLGLILKVGLVAGTGPLLGLTLDFPPLIAIMMIEALFLGVTTLPMGQRLPLFAQLVVDTLLWALWLHFSGGATNAFVTLLLMPVAISAVMLPLRHALCIAALACLSYSLMMLSMPHDAHMHDSQMAAHFLGMWLNFLLSCAVLLGAVAVMARRRREQEQELARLRESQLRQEHLLALGTASAQLAHQLATPLSTLTLLHEEALEQHPDSPLLPQMSGPLSLCQQSLNGLRQTSEKLRSDSPEPQSLEALLSGLKTQLQLLLPQIELDVSPCSHNPWLSGDPALQPALLSLAYNGAQASLRKGSDKLALQVSMEAEGIILVFRDWGPGLGPMKEKLGRERVESRSLGVGLLLSHATFERLGGSLRLSNHREGGAEARICLPEVAR
ncbi:integral membrane sensor signal transduction histidine kinase [Ferrimonas balearica DSM 9799]|uniref:histidine kinase n=1 Tax=Ferrimonas balearica (strain DSM 9799 / CCM 4581 / KCTC 23876 / PAT) TaxID=550540 RepID=E1SP83_FERBD|nr:HAMP domain-containing histidine kinase [Ferrimonas balearica]ADN75708.1 integral membrane sensor signal transduction histidine kinase [Ferrimonas balearica DSM 9799]MBW3163804.1 HAMP domain-containing histidine kinase [Ferrimonas balearica]MBY5979376.1 HAMP domain-containing histidine kinase [Ferrimonas balearica]